MPSTFSGPPPGHLTRGALRVDDEQFDIADVVLLALAEGRWQRLAVSLGRGLALEREHGRDVARERVAQQVTRFRYERRLIAGKDFREWLAARGLVLADVHRHCLRGMLIAEHGPDGNRVTPDPRDVHTEALVSGLTGETAARLGDLAAMAAAVDPVAGPPVQELVAEAAAAGLEGDDLTYRASRVLRLLAAERAFVAHTATPDAVARSIATHGVDWLRVECSELLFPSEGAAHEALLCVRADGMSPASLAGWLAVGLRRSAQFVGDVGGARAGVLASVPIGEPVGPLAGEEGWRVLVVDRRVTPAREDPELARRATAEVVRTAVDRLRAGRVHELAAL
ncbi:hypothetical protein [Pseudonocardia sp. 73-21]|uniref:hypothetical protein n=1 Tax=Pseudonocardia sp. 73-21 TaxID=1895809 RepID=UPI000961C472|nr:hypothetical protein [Pseudonocardia sp. 73-21]OJY54315.1 MAG: hypothetical protein BGP03_04185 [Pseudonocardia sp. 73-21]